MAYTPTNWQNGDVITAEKLNKAEQGIATANRSVLIVTEDAENVLSEKWKDIFDAYPFVLYKMSIPGVVDVFYPLAHMSEAEGAYSVVIGETTYTATSVDGYPVKSIG